MRSTSLLRCLFGCVLAVTACGGGDAEVPGVSDSLAQQSSRPNQPPVVESVRFDPAEPRVGEDVRVEVTITDPDDDPVRATYEWTLDGVVAGGGGRRLDLGDRPRDTGFSVTVVASDGRAESEPVTASGRVHNTLPWIEGIDVEPGDEITAGYPIRGRARTHDPDGDEVVVAYRWKLNGFPESGRAEGPVFVTDGLAPGDVVTLEVKAEDDYGESEAFASTPLRIVNRPPRVTSRPGAAVAGSFRYRIDVEDPDGDTVIYELARAPEGMRIERGSGDIEWRPAAGQAGRHQVRVLVDDLRGGQIAHDFELRVDGPPAARDRGAL